MAKLTWNQHRALVRLRPFRTGATPSQIGEQFSFSQNYLCGSAARTALMALARKGLAEMVSTAPIKYRITAAGLDALSTHKET